MQSAFSNDNTRLQAAVLQKLPLEWHSSAKHTGQLQNTSNDEKLSQIAAAGVGYKIGNELTHMDIKTAADLRRISQEKLMQKFGERIGAFLYLACRGQVSSPVTMLVMIIVTGFRGQVSSPVTISVMIIVTGCRV